MSLKIEHLTWEQERLHLSLVRAIADARATNAGSVKCVDNPQRWDDPTTAVETPCDGCPVFDLCNRYADTGAVTHGILANRIMGPTRADRRRAAAAAREQAAA